MKTLEVVLQELPKCDTETWSEQMLLGKMVPIDLFNADLPKLFNLWKTCYLWSTVKWSWIKWGIPAFSVWSSQDSLFLLLKRKNNLGQDVSFWDAFCIMFCIFFLLWLSSICIFIRFLSYQNALWKRETQCNVLSFTANNQKGQQFCSHTDCIPPWY